MTGLRGRSGDPAPITAFGVCQGLKACARFRYGEESLEGRHVVVQGLGRVGYHLCKHLAEEGARLSVADIEDERVRKAVTEFGATAVAPDDVYGIDADIFSPCALGAVINDDTLDTLKVDIVAGSANNQLAETRHGGALHDRGIVYAPDYVISAGGICSVYGELEGWTARAEHGKSWGNLRRPPPDFRACPRGEYPDQPGCGQRGPPGHRRGAPGPRCVVQAAPFFPELARLR